ncbi:MAG: ABC transporter permease [Candidatus Peribacteraceae bacterium]|nr:ABC transporter permease [Candidatus Peribacteraceae bacterium]
MRFPDILRAASKGVTVNLLRSFLTMLGIIIGVGAVVLMSAVGESMQGVILSQISSLGPKSMVIFPGQQEGGASAVATGFDSLTFEDIRELEQLKTVTAIAPAIFVPQEVSYGRESGNPRVVGVTDTFFLNQNVTARTGRLIDEDDVGGAKAVAVMGPESVEKFFGSGDPLGKRLKIGDRHFTVVGTANKIGSQFFQSVDDRIFIPLSLAKDLTGQKYVNLITMQATGSFDLAFDDVNALLRRRHSINNPKNDPAKDDFIVRSAAQASEILGSVTLGLTLFITTVATISLIVGGIGIMNIMLVSVSERTQEIGLRKAIGATRRDILLQFLTEAVVLTVIGGIIGIVGGIALAWLLSFIVRIFLSTYIFAVSPAATVVAFVMAFFTGLLFGINPARKAAALQPIEALRYE